MIGIMTPFMVNNYGTKLQAFAMQSLIKSFDKDCEIINYSFGRRRITLSRIAKKIYYHHYTKSYRDYTDSENVPDDIRKMRSSREKTISRFNEMLSLSKPIISYQNLRDKSEEYETVICGSDQIWNPVNLDGEVYLLEWTNEHSKRIAYAASFGTDQITDALKHKYKKELLRFDSISVREDTGVSIIKELGISNVHKVMDPTLLCDGKLWRELAASSSMSIEKPYVFCYFLSGRSLPRQAVKCLAREDNLTIVNLPHFKEYNKYDENFADVDLYGVGVPDFLALILNANYVVTDSFHGTVFSTIFEKEFFAFERHSEEKTGSTNGRIFSYLHTIGLENRICRSIDDMDRIRTKRIDYAKMWPILLSQIDISRRYLEATIE